MCVVVVLQVFLGFISPTAESCKETLHTLEFIERCQKALTMKQMPVWKTDERMIKGLTGRVISLQTYIDQVRLLPVHHPFILAPIVQHNGSQDRLK